MFKKIYYPFFLTSLVGSGYVGKGCSGCAFIDSSSMIVCNKTKNSGIVLALLSVYLFKIPLNPSRAELALGIPGNNLLLDQLQFFPVNHYSTK